MSFQSIIKHINTHGVNYSYNQHAKDLYKKVSLQVLKQIAKDLNYSWPLTKQQLRFNEWWIAVNGHATLMIMLTPTQWLYIWFRELHNSIQLLYRTISWPKDFSWSSNNWFSLSSDYTQFIQSALSLLNK